MSVEGENQALTETDPSAPSGDELDTENTDPVDGEETEQ